MNYHMLLLAVTIPLLMLVAVCNATVSVGGGTVGGENATFAPGPPHEPWTTTGGIQNYYNFIPYVSPSTREPAVALLSSGPIGPQGGLSRIDMQTGKVLWFRNITTYTMWNTQTAGAIFFIGGDGPPCWIAAIHLETGATVWNTSTSNAWLTGILISVRHELVVAQGRGVVGIAMHTGKILWSVPATTVGAFLFEDGPTHDPLALIILNWEPATVLRVNTTNGAVMWNSTALGVVCNAAWSTQFSHGRLIWIPTYAPPWTVQSLDVFSGAVSNVTTIVNATDGTPQYWTAINTNTSLIFAHGSAITAFHSNFSVKWSIDFPLPGANCSGGMTSALSATQYLGIACMGSSHINGLALLDQQTGALQWQYTTPMEFAFFGTTFTVTESASAVKFNVLIGIQNRLLLLDLAFSPRPVWDLTMSGGVQSTLFLQDNAPNSQHFPTAAVVICNQNTMATSSVGLLNISARGSNDRTFQVTSSHQQVAFALLSPKHQSGLIVGDLKEVSRYTSTGTLQWQFSWKASEQMNTLWWGGVIEDRFYVLMSDAHVAVFEIEGLTYKGLIKLPAPLYNVVSPAVGAGGRLFYGHCCGGNYRSMVVVVDPAAGTTVSWPVPMQNANSNSITNIVPPKAVAAPNHQPDGTQMLFVLDAASTVHAFDGRTGEAMWNVSVEWAASNNFYQTILIAMADTLIVAGGWQVFGFSTTDGSPAWGPVNTSFLTILYKQQAVVSAHGTEVYLFGPSGVFKLRCADGTILWSYTTTAQYVFSGIALNSANTVLLVGGPTFLALDPETGAELWGMTSGQCESPLAVAFAQRSANSTELMLAKCSSGLVVVTDAAHVPFPRFSLPYYPYDNQQATFVFPSGEDSRYVETLGLSLSKDTRQGWRAELEVISVADLFHQ